MRMGKLPSHTRPQDGPPFSEWGGRMFTAINAVVRRRTGQWKCAHRFGRESWASVLVFLRRHACVHRRNSHVLHRAVVSMTWDQGQ